MPKPVYRRDRHVEAQYGSIDEYLDAEQTATGARIVWRRSSRGNLWARVEDGDGGEVTVTVFWQDGEGWRVCVAGTEKRIRYYPVDAADEDEATAIVEDTLEELIGCSY